MLNLLDELRRRPSLTFIMESHGLAVVTHMCDRLMVMQRGETVELVSSADLAPLGRRMVVQSRRAC